MSRRRIQKSVLINESAQDFVEWCEIHSPRRIILRSTIEKHDVKSRIGLNDGQAYGEFYCPGSLEDLRKILNMLEAEEVLENA